MAIATDYPYDVQFTAAVKPNKPTAPQAPASAYALVNEYALPDSTLPTLGLVRQHVGKRVKFTPPEKTQQANVANLVRALNAYDINPTPTNATKIKSLMATMGFKASRIVEDPNVLFFYPTKVAVYGISFMWRFGKVKVPGDPTSYNSPANTVYPNCVVSPHEGTDGATIPAIKEFLLGGKFALFNAAHAHSSDASSPQQKSRNLSDPAHSSATLFVPFLKTALQEIYPYMVTSVTHGLSDTNSNGKQKQLRLWFINVYNHEFLKNSKSWPGLLSIAMAAQKFKDRSISVGSQLPGFIPDGKGGKIPLTTPSNANNPLFMFMNRSPQTDVVAHIANHANSVSSRGQRLDNAWHGEHGGPYKEDSAYLSGLNAAIKQAMEWNLKWDDRVHTTDETKLPDWVLNDMTQYGKWFDQQLKLLPSTPKVAARSANIEVHEDDDPEQLIDESEDTEEGSDGSLVSVDLNDQPDTVVTDTLNNALMFSTASLGNLKSPNSKETIRRRFAR